MRGFLFIIFIRYIFFANVINPSILYNNKGKFVSFYILEIKLLINGLVAEYSIKLAGFIPHNHCAYNNLLWYVIYSAITLQCLIYFFTRK